MAIPVQEDASFNVGDVVRLKSGGCKMMVERLECSGDRVNCLYWCPGPPDPDLGSFREISLDMVLLQKVDPVSAHEDIPY